ncbi:hypothetical protein ATB93_05350 [Sphingomonas sp. WG]|jgi:hypothetical protein|nr:hypothetical protein ATB93_05350 [Sphingomonas sp. WG]
MLKRRARAIEFLDFYVQGSNLLAGKLARLRTIIGRVQHEQVTYLFKSESRGLSRADEAKPAHIFGPIAPDPAARSGSLRTLGRVEESASLIIANRLDADATLTR